MLNYLNAELWRMSRRRGPRVLCVVYLGLVAFTAWSWSLETTLAGSLESLRAFMALGLYLCFPFAATADGAGSREVLRNEASFGLSRARIYLGKFLAGFLAGMGMFLLTLAVYLGVALSMTRVGPGEAAAVSLALARLWEGAWIALPRYAGALSLAHLLCFTLRSEGLGAVLYYLYMTLGELILSAMNIYGLGTLGKLINWASEQLRPYLLSSAFFSFYGGDGIPPGVWESLLTGGVWLAVTTAVGLFLFRRREIR